MNLYPSQESIVTKLAADLATADSEFLAKDLPDSQADYDVAVKKPIAYVIYAGSQALPSVAANVISQPRKLKFNVEFHSKKLYGQIGLFLVRDILEQSLVGFKPTNCGRLSLLKDDISKTEEGIWVHVYQFECETMLVQKSDSDPVIVPVFVELTTEE
jgi:hypothetical protein